MTDLPTLPVTYRARTLLIWASGFSLVLVGGALLGWFALDPRIRALFNWFQIATLILITLVLIGFMMALGMSVVVADADGVRIRNAISVRRLRWDQIHQLQYRRNDPWAYAVTQAADGEQIRRQMMGIQSTDGERAHRAVAELRALHAHFTRGEPSTTGPAL